jgi:hypothetical protein
MPVSTALAEKVTEVTNEAMLSPDGNSVWRGLIGTEEWKISANYNPDGEIYDIRCQLRGTV